MKRFAFVMIMVSTVLLSANAQLRNSSAGMETMPFKYYGHLYFPAIFNDSIHGNMVFDTGAANYLLVDSTYMKQVGWKTTKLVAAKMSGAAGDSKTWIDWSEARVKTQGMSLKYPYTVLINLRDILGCHADALLGIRDMKGTPFEINYQHHYLRKLSSISDSVRGEYQRIPIKNDGVRMLVKASMDIDTIHVEGWFVLDTGSGGVVDFTKAATEKYNLMSVSRKKIIGKGLQMGVGNRGISTSVDMLSDRFVIGSDTIGSACISCHSDGEGAFGERPWIGIIGNGIWDQYSMIVDMPHNTLYLKCYRPYENQEKMYGFSFNNRTDIGKGWIVRYLIEGSEAAKQGLKLGDTILSVNGKAVTDYSWDEEEKVTSLSSLDLKVKDVAGHLKHIHITPSNLWIGEGK